MTEEIISLIKNNQDIPKNQIKLHYINKDGNCWYRLLSKYYTNDEKYYKTFRQIIFESAKNNKELLAPFFLNSEEGVDNVIINIKLEHYIDKIREDSFYAGNIELAISSIIFNLNISIYTSENDEDTVYKHFTNIWKNINYYNTI